MARRFARRRKPRVAWLPVYGDNGYGEQGAGGDAIGIRYELTCPAPIAPTNLTYDAVAITWDGGDSPSAAQAFGSTEHSLSDFVQGQSYRLRRIVGKFFCQVGQPGASNIVTVQVGFGFIVLRGTDAGAPTTSPRYVNPLFQDSADDPWIWRRTWLLTTSSVWNTPYSQFPRTNVAYGSVADGPHIDQKTARVIGPQERLYGIAAARILQTSDDLAPSGEVTVHGYLDYRLLASMRSNVGNRGNASR